MKIQKTFFLGLLFFVVCSGCVEEAKVGKADFSPDIERRVEKLLAKMTLEEKLGQMSQMHEVYRKDSLILEDEILAGRVGAFLNLFDVEKRNRFQRIAVEGRLSALDISGVVSLVKSKINKAYKSRLKLARAFRSEVANTKADITSAFQTMIHMRQEVQRALYGIRKR